jgi:hypothetical protein
MTGESHWLDFFVVFGGGFVLVAVLLLVSSVREVRRRKLRFVCPVISEDVTCTAVQNISTGEWQDIERCSAFTPPTNVHCPKTCRDLLNAGDLVARR